MLSLTKMRETSDGAFVNYLKRAVYHIYVKKLKQKIEASKIQCSVFSELSDLENHYIETSLSANDTYFESQILESRANLTEYEYEILQMIYRNGLSISLIAKKMNKSRQAINQAKNKGLEKLRAVADLC
jgi:DNA-directed RNA polymerase specialized sigma subunit